MVKHRSMGVWSARHTGIVEGEGGMHLIEETRLLWWDHMKK